MTGKTTRRVFLGTGAAAALLPSTATRARAAGSNDAVHIGLIGCGGRGRYLIDRFAKVDDARIVAVCDVHAGRAEEARQQLGGGTVEAVGDFRRIVEHPDLDAVIVATTPHWHAVPAIAAVRAGKDVYLEKPLATSIAEGRAIADAVAASGRIVQIGTQQRSWEHYQKAVELIQAGRLGEICEVEVWDVENYAPGNGAPPDGAPPEGLDWDFFCGPAPLRPYNSNRFFNHNAFLDYAGGWALDWAVHHHDIVHWAMGAGSPLSAAASGGRLGLADDNREWPDTLTGVVEYGPTKVAPRGFVTTYRLRTASAGQPSLHGKKFYGSDATMVLDRGSAVITGETRRGKKLTPDETIAGGREDHFVEVHAANFVRCVKAREQPFASVGVGHATAIPGHLVNIAWQTGRKVKWDGATEAIPDDADAAALLTRTYRTPWTIQ